MSRKNTAVMSKIDLNLNFDEIEERISQDKIGIKPSAWADKIGVSRNVVTNVHGKIKQKPSLEYIVAVSKATGKSVDYYLWGSETEEQSEAKLIDVNKKELDIFRNKERALELIKQLSTIENLNPQMFEMVGQQIEAVYNTVVASNPGKLSRSHSGSSG